MTTKQTNAKPPINRTTGRRTASNVVMNRVVDQLVYDHDVRIKQGKNDDDPFKTHIPIARWTQQTWGAVYSNLLADRFEEVYGSKPNRDTVRRGLLRLIDKFPEYWAMDYEDMPRATLKQIFKLAVEVKYGH